MAPHMQEDFGDDFEVIEVPKPDQDHQEPTTKSGIYAVKGCGSPYCQSSHVSREEEMKSGRAIEPLLDIMRANAKALSNKGPIFHALSYFNRYSISAAFAEGVPTEYRRILNCTACKRFMKQYGDLCVVAEDGSLTPLAWPTHLDNVPQYYRVPVENVLKLFQDQIVCEEFVIRTVKNRVLGTPTSGGWNHMSIELPGVALAGSNSSMDSQNTSISSAMLDKDTIMVSPNPRIGGYHGTDVYFTVLQDNSPTTVAMAHHLLVHDILPYATSHKAAITFLQDTSTKLEAQKLQDLVKRKNLVTKSAREAFPGCLSSLRGGMIGFLLDCITKGEDLEDTKDMWQEKANPISYMRPTAAPSVGNIESAEKIFARLGYTPRDLERVYLTVDQVPQSGILWPSSAGYVEPLSDATSKATLDNNTQEPQKLFGNLIEATRKPTKITAPYTDAPLQDCTFRKFVLAILPNVSELAVLPAKEIQPFFLTTGKDNSKPIMSFHKDGSHTASWYTWGDPSSPKHATMKPEWTPVRGIISFPHMWDEFASAAEGLDEAKAEEFKFKRHGIKYLFCVEGAKEASTDRNLCLFPTLMKGEFHSVRKTVEAFSQKGRMEAPEKGKEHVVGFQVRKDKESDLVVGVKTKTGRFSRYKIAMFD